MTLWSSFSDEMRKMALAGEQHPFTTTYREHSKDPAVKARIDARRAAAAARAKKAFPSSVIRATRGARPIRKAGMILAGLAGLFGGGALGYKLGRKDKDEAKESSQ